MTQWYFAYGSNLWLEQMIERTGAFPAGTEAPRLARLPNYRLAFNMRGADGQAFANLMSPGNGMLGVVYCCSPEALVKMDVFEKGYQRGSVRVVLENGEKLDAATYFAEATHVANGLQPQADYLQKILRGARQHRLPETYIREIEAIAKAER
jgi:gamma-glutamylcyclotransferase